MKSMIIIASLAGAATTAGVVRVAEAQPAFANVALVSASGPACPNGIPGAMLTSSRRYLSIAMPDNFKAAVGPGASAGARSTSCTITVALDVPRDWTFGVSQVRYQGSGSLAAGVIGQLSLSHWFQGSLIERAEVTRTLHGPHFGSFQGAETPSDVVFAPCGQSRALNIDIDLSVSNTSRPRASGTMSAGPGVYWYGLLWRKC
jgi:hypothetical protein